MLGLTLGALPHFSYQPIWVAVLFMTMIGWRCMNILRGWRLPNQYNKKLKWLLHFITVATMLLLVNSYGNLIGRDAGAALLTVMLSLKVTEINSHRDYYLSCFLGYFLVATNFFYSQSIATALLMFIVVTIMTASLISLNDSQQSLTKKATFRLAVKMLLQSIPLMIVLFVLFPRISGPLWGLPNDAHAAKTGMSDSMSIGSISNLIQSDEVAFRVKFDGELPEQSQLYWRGPVLWHTDGKKWTELAPSEHSLSTPVISRARRNYSYTSTIEPHDKNWLFALDFPNQLPAGLKANLTHDGQLRSDSKISQRQQVQLSANTLFNFNAENEPLLSHALALPGNMHPQTLALAKTWRKQTQDPVKLAQIALRYFNQQNFYYSLSPPPLSEDGIDSFLFETRSGFCEHYSASFTILMRAAGVPTRVVTGYLGGEINPVDDFLVIRQRDAHAWTEIWVRGQGWLRIDPTSAVSQERIEQGMNTIMPATMRAPILISGSLKLSELWHTLSHNWDALDNQWNQWILAYGPKLQKEVLAKLGMTTPNWQTMASWLFIAISVVLLALSILLFYQRRQIDPVVQLYARFCNKAEKLGINREVSEGPYDFAQRCKQQLPNYADEIEQITSLYVSLRYGGKSSKIQLLKQSIKDFKPHL